MHDVLSRVRPTLRVKPRLHHLRHRSQSRVGLQPALLDGLVHRGAAHFVSWRRLPQWRGGRILLRPAFRGRVHEYLLPSIGRSRRDAPLPSPYPHETPTPDPTPSSRPPPPSPP